MQFVLYNVDLTNPLVDFEVVLRLEPSFVDIYMNTFIERYNTQISAFSMADASMHSIIF